MLSLREDQSGCMQPLPRSLLRRAGGAVECVTRQMQARVHPGLIATIRLRWQRHQAQAACASMARVTCVHCIVHAPAMLYRSGACKGCSASAKWHKLSISRLSTAELARGHEETGPCCAHSHATAPGTCCLASLARCRAPDAPYCSSARRSADGHNDEPSDGQEGRARHRRALRCHGL